jgi:hypothetical protein
MVVVDITRRRLVAGALVTEASASVAAAAEVLASR